MVNEGERELCMKVGARPEEGRHSKEVAESGGASHLGEIEGRVTLFDKACTAASFPNKSVLRIFTCVFPQAAACKCEGGSLLEEKLRRGASASEWLYARTSTGCVTPWESFNIDNL